MRHLPPLSSRLLALAALLLAWGLVRGKADAAGRNRIPRSIRMLSSALVLLAALVQRRAGGDELDLVASGMICGFVGDLALAKVIRLPEPVLAGMASFAVGHCCYLAALVGRARRDGLTAPGPWAAALGLAGGVGLLGWALTALPSHHGAALRFGALPYTLLLAAMAGGASALAVQDRRYTSVALGGWLFLLSDTILAAELFRDAHFPHIGDTIWLTYIAGQGCIVAGMGATSAR